MGRKARGNPERSLNKGSTSLNIKVTHQPLPSYHFEGKIAVPQDKDYVQNYLDFPFDIPAGVGALRLRLQYTPPKVGEISNLTRTVSAAMPIAARRTGRSSCRRC